MARTDGVQMAARAAALPWVVGTRWLAPRSAGAATEGQPRPTGWATKFRGAIDELFFVSEYVAGAPFVFGGAARVMAEVDAAVRLYGERGWLETPEQFHPQPPPITDAEETWTRLGPLGCRLLRFPSAYAPWMEEPGRARWLGYAANHSVHVRLYVHPGPERPWLVCVPGYRMGNMAVDYVGFRIGWLHQTLGLNVAVPVKPLHGPRAMGRRGGDGYLAGDFLDTVHAQAQAVWDIRRLIAWLRARGAPAVGAFGVSLGGYTVALLAALEPELACVIAGVPAVDFVDLIAANSTDVWFAVTEWLGFDWASVRQLLRVVSPLAQPARVAHARRFVLGAASDALVPPSHALRLWEHWERPHLAWSDGGHVSFFLEPAVKELIAGALRQSGLIAT